MTRWLLAFVLLFPIEARSQTPAPPLTLDQAVGMASSNNRLVKVKAIEVERAEHELAALKTRRRPNFDVKMFDGSLASPMALIFPTGAFGTFPTTGPIPSQDTSIRNDPRFSAILFAQVAQPLTQLRTIAYGVRALELTRDLRREELRAEQQAIGHDVKRLYYGLFEAEGGLAANEQALALYHELDRVVGEYVARQVALPAESLSVKAALARQELTSVVLRNTIATLKEQLNLMLGRDVSADVATVAPPADTIFEVDLPTAQSAALDRRPEIREARLKKQQADADLRRTRAEALPTVSATFNYLGFYNFDVLPKASAFVGVLGTWEPWDWGRKREEASAKSLTIDQAELGIKQAEDAIRVEVAEKFRKVQESRAMLRVMELEQDTARERLRVVIDRYKLEASLERQALEAQAASAEAGQHYRQALAAFWTARADFDKAIGSAQ